MKEVNITQDNTVFSHDASSGNKLCCLEQYVLQDRWHELEEILVIESPKSPGKYVVYDGNHRFRLAIVFDKPLRGKLIENNRDLQEVIDSKSKHCCHGKRNAPWGDTYELVKEQIGKPICTPDVYPQYYTRKINWDTPNKEKLQQMIQKTD